MRAMTTWFCDGYSSWQKGGENGDGRLRRWLHRQIDIDQVCDEEIQDIVIISFPFFLGVDYVLQNRGGLESMSVEHQQFGIAVGGGAVP
jgi:hypothetical protein